MSTTDPVATATTNGSNKESVNGGPEQRLEHGAPVEGEGAGRPTSGASASHDSLFDARRITLSQDFASMIGVRKETKTVPVRRPNRQDWCRTHPSWRLSPIAMLEVKDEGTSSQIYLVDPHIAQQVPPGEVKAMALFAAVNRQNVFFLWPVRLAGTGRRDHWSESSMEAARAAEHAWVRTVANTSLGAYEIFESSSDAKPQWPGDIASLEQAMEIAFRDQFITTLDHPVLRRLRGEL